MKKNWYAAYTRSRCEKKVAALFSKRKIENYCPLNRIMKQWSDRKKLVYEPLFTSYVFIHASEEELYAIKQVTTDVINFVYWLGKPAVIKDAEIEAIRSFLDEYSNVKLEENFVRVSDKVRVLNGPLMNMEGNIMAIENNKVKLSLPSLGYMMIAEVRKSNIEVLNYPYKINTLVS
jgi:transcription antitermination factor NusG